MIPLFPEFKNIELADKPEVEQFAADLPPYSDYNFASLWSWNTNGATQVSALNGNMVVRFTDYLTGKPFYSFIGRNMVNETARQLLDLSISEGLQPVLKLVPEESVREIDPARFAVAEDRDNHDYVYDIDTFAGMSEPKFHVRRRQCRFFAKTFAHEVRRLPLREPLVKEQIIDLFHEWIRMKLDKGSDDYFENEYLALLRYLQIAESTDCFALGVYVEGRLASAIISENVGGGYNVSHFQKAVGNYKGLNVYQIHCAAVMLKEMGIRFINWEQDLGIPGLRENKESYLPAAFLKKFTLSTP